jgi:hypothetical protein
MSARELLTPKDAARRIFNTSAPTDQEIGAVIQEMKSGALQRSAPEAWTTTLEAVADYLAKQDQKKNRSQRRGSVPAGAAPASVSDPNISKFYNGLVKDYFLAVVMQRGMREHSRSFQQAVIATQALLLACGLSVLVYSAFLFLQEPFVPAEHQAIQKWLAGRYSTVKISEIQPVANQPQAFLAKFKYQESGRVIESKLKLVVQNGAVATVDSPD